MEKYLYLFFYTNLCKIKMWRREMLMDWDNEYTNEDKERSISCFLFGSLISLSLVSVSLCCISFYGSFSLQTWIVGLFPLHRFFFFFGRFLFLYAKQAMHSLPLTFPSHLLYIELGLGHFFPHSFSLLLHSQWLRPKQFHDSCITYFITNL